MSEMVLWVVTGLRARPKLLRGLFLLILGAVLLFDTMAERHAAHFFGDNMRFFWAIFGLLGAILMTKFMKGIGHAFIMQPPDFYSRKDKGED